MQLTITLPDLDTQDLGKTEAEMRLDVAIFLYLAWKMPVGRCAEYAGVSKVLFLDELGRLNIPINYDMSALEQDRQNWTNFLKSHDSHQRHHLS
jgi:predicted HTH domain antitoxin